MEGFVSFGPVGGKLKRCNLMQHKSLSWWAREVSNLWPLQCQRTKEVPTRVVTIVLVSSGINE
jgi:hypothetical protein